MAHDEDPQNKKSCSQKCDGIMRSIWNSDKKEFIGRTGSSWAKIGVFYLIFYSCLAGFFAIMLVGFFSTLDSNAPTQQGMYSLIKGNPGMGFRPMANIESTLIKFTTGDKASYKMHTENLEKVLKDYKTQPVNAIDCTVEKEPDRDSDKVCEFTLEQLGANCTAENDFGYFNGTPCVVLKVNKVFGWEPRPFENTTEEYSSGDEEDRHAEAHRLLGDRMDPTYIGVTCDGENDGDSDNIFNVDYYPKKGFSYRYFPYYNHPNYMQPLVFVQFNVRKGALIQVWCKLWARNIKHHKNDKAGSTHFELLVD